jgi:hypothetical protein
MSRYRVEKQAAEAVLLLIDGSSLKGSLYLAPYSAHHSGPQNVADLMREPDPVVPFACADGRFILVGKESVAAVRFAANDQRDSELVVRIAARMRLAGGHTVHGAILAEQGAGERASDLLNTPDAWVQLEGVDCFHWIAKRYLLTLEPDEG